jgi:hypothetical protein
MTPEAVGPMSGDDLLLPHAPCRCPPAAMCRAFQLSTAVTTYIRRPRTA